MYTTDIAAEAQLNSSFRHVLFTSVHVQLVVMALKAGEDIGSEIHDHTDQVFTFVSGFVLAEVNGSTQNVGPGDLVIVPAGTRHNFTNVGDEPVRLYTIYSPPNHEPGTVHQTKADAIKAATFEID